MSIYEANRRPKGRHPLFCFISFIGIYYPLTDIVIVHIVYINESNPYSPHAPCERRVARRRGARAGSVSESNPRPNLKMREVQTVTLDGFWKQDYGWGVRVRRPFGARERSSVLYGTRLGDLKENWFLLFSN